MSCLSLLGAERPNVILILADDLGYGDLGCYGQKHIRTPNLDRLAAEGMRFTQFYAGSTVCAPSRCVLMTGRHLGHARVRGNASTNQGRAQMLRDEDVTVAEVMKSAGYATGLVGKWGLGLPGDEGVPTWQGFDYFYGYLSQHHAHNHYPAFLWRNQSRVVLSNGVVAIGADGGGYATNRVQYAGDLLAEEARDFVARNRAQPFFLYWSPIVPHANNERYRVLKDGQEVPDYGIYADRDWPNPYKGQAAMITRLDAQVGQLMARLKELDLDERTLVLFTSDNGPHQEGGNDPDFFDANGPLRGIKRDLTDGGIRVPLVARWPGKIPAGTTSDHVGYFGDFLKTLAQLAGARTPRGLDSISFLPTLLGQPRKQMRHPYLYWEFYEKGFRQAVRWGDWKGIRLGTDQPIALYQLKDDMGETNNVTAQYPEVVRKMAKIMKAAHRDNAFWKIKPPDEAR